MTEYGVTDDGFVLKRTDQVLADIASELDATYPGLKTLDGESVIGNIAGTFSAALGQCWEVAQMANNQHNPRSARGANLSSLVMLNGIVRKSGETDVQVRERQARATFAPSGAIVESIYSALSSLDGVTFCRVYVNETGVFDERGIPGHSVAVVIVGGDDGEIAETIFGKMPAGIYSHGSTVVSVVDAQDFTNLVRFTRPTEIDIFVTVELVTDLSFPLDGIDQIKQAIIDYAAGGADALGWSAGNIDGFPPGTEVSRSLLHTPINSVVGQKVYNDRLLIGKQLTFQAPLDIQILWNQVAKFTTDNITATVVG